MQTTKSDQNLIQTISQLGLMTDVKLHECLKLLSDLKEHGQTIQLSQILLKYKYLSLEQLKLVQKTLSLARDRASAQDKASAQDEASAQDKALAQDKTLNFPQEREKVAEEIEKNKDFGRYKIVRELGRGGMGAVYQAYDPELKRHVALKIILNQAFTSETEQKRFAREARLMAKLNHPNIIKVFDVGQENQSPFFAMELVEGSVLLEEDMPLPRLIKILAHVADAVHYAHQQGIIHRDLKPSNIMVNKDGEPKVMDFGLAKDIQSDEQLSESSAMLGTPEYMSPEQALGYVKDVDARTDIYALGVILYRILAGRTPFHASSRMELLRKITTEEPPIISHSSKVPMELEAICFKALEKEKARRYQSALDFANDMERYLEGKAVLARPVTSLVRVWKWIRRNRIVSGFCTLFGLMVIATVGIFVYQKDQQAENEKRLRTMAVFQKNEADRLRIEAEKHRKIAEEQKEKAIVKEVEAKLSQAHSELILARMHIENRDYFHAMEKQKKAKALSNDALETLVQTNIFAGKDEFKNLFHRQLVLAKTARDMFVYSISLNPHLSKNSESFGQMPDMTEIVRQCSHFMHISFHLPAHLAFSPPSTPSWRFIVAYNEEGNTIIWDMNEQKKVKSFPFRIPNRNVEFSPDEKFVALGDTEGNLTVWKIGTEETYRITIESEDKTIRALRFTPDMSYLLAATREKIILLDFPSMKIAWTVPYGGAGITCAFSKNGKWLAVGGIEGMAGIHVHLYSFDDIKKKVTEPARRILGQAMSLCFGPEDKILIAGGTNDINIFSLDSSFMQENLTLLSAHRGEIHSVALSPDNNYFVSIGQEGKMALWSTYNFRKIFQSDVAGYMGNFCAVSFHPDNQHLGIWNYNAINVYSYGIRAIQTLDLIHRKEVATKKSYTDLIQQLRRSSAARNFGNDATLVSISPTGENVAYFMIPNLFLWNMEQDELTCLHSELQGMNRDVSFSTDGSLVLWRSHNRISVWQTRDKRLILPIGWEKEWGARLSFQPITNMIVGYRMRSSSNFIRFWKIDNSKLSLFKEIQAQINTIQLCTFDRDGRKFAIVADEGKLIQVYDCDSEQLISSCQLGTKNTIRSICFSTGKYVALGDYTNGNFSICDWENKKIVHSISLYNPIKSLWYNDKEKVYWIFSKDGLFVYPHWDDKSFYDQLDRIYPLPVFSGYPLLAAEISSDFHYACLALQSGEVWKVPLSQD